MLKHRPDLAIYVPRGFRREGFELLRQAEHTGAVTVVEPKRPIVPCPGLAIANFPMETSGRARTSSISTWRTRA